MILLSSHANSILVPIFLVRPCFLGRELSFSFMEIHVSVVTFTSRNYDIDDQHFIYYYIQPKIVQNTRGITEYDDYRMATLERALCDYIYLHPKASIDAPALIDQRRIEKLYSFYPKKRF